MTWLLAAFVTALMSALLTGAVSLLNESGLVAITEPAPLAILAAQSGVFALCRWTLAAYLARLSSCVTAPAWLQFAVLWMAEACPRWLLAYAAILGVILWVTTPLLARGLFGAVLWGAVWLVAVAATAAALVPDAAWRLALPALDEDPE